MPRPTSILRAGGRFALAALVAAVPPPTLHAALASAAGTVFEAVPFVLVAALLPRSVIARVAPLVGCGCGRSTGPAALSLPAAALCWLTFGPLVAAVRFGAGVLVALVTRRRAGTGEPVRDPLAELEQVGLTAFVLALGLAALQSHRPPSLPHPAGDLLSMAAGLLAGAAAPCATAAIGAAAVLRHPYPLVAVGLLAGTGLIALPAARSAGRPARKSRNAFLLGATACALLWARGGAGFVNPRLAPLVGGGALLCLLASRSAAQTRARSPLALGGALLAALIFGSPLPRFEASAATADEAFAGERLSFTGAVHQDARSSRLVRFVITCCRADAAPLVVRTVHRLPVAEGVWVQADGTFANDAGRLVLKVDRWRETASPADPFLYR